MDHGKAKENEFDAKSYDLSGKIMLIAIVILFFVIIIMVCLHMYARWYLIQARRRPPRRNRQSRRSPHIVFYVDPAAPSGFTVASRGLDPSVIASLPVFSFSPKTHPDPVECVVCLSEFDDGETGRILPKCNHSFHIECIDMWFQSHSTCPLCRAPVEPPPDGETRPESVVNVTVCEPGSSSGLCGECQHEGEEVNRTGPAVSTSSSLRKPSSLVGVTVEVPGRSESFGDESGCDSPSTQSSFRSPMGRMLSFKRILSRERKASISPSSGCVVGCSSMAELDVERGGREETH